MFSMPDRLEPDPRRWSLTLRLTLFFSLAMGSMLIVVAWLMHEQLTKQLHEKDEATLTDAMRVQIGVVKSFAHAGATILAVPEVSEFSVTDAVGFRVLAPDGRVYSESRGLTVPSSAFPDVNPKQRFKRWKAPTGEFARYLLATTPVEADSGQMWLIYAAEDLTQSYEILAAFRKRLLLVLFAAILASSLTGWWLVRRGLAPLRAMSSTIEQIDAHRLSSRIGQQSWPSDLRALAHSFDAMLHRLEAAFDQLSRFSSDLAHEFRSPITNLVAAASVMLARERTASEYQETLAVVVEDGERLSRMVSSMLFLARADNAKQALRPEPLSTAQEFRKLIEAFEASADEQGVLLRARGDSGVTADPMLLRRALSNLIINALHHTPSGGSIELDAIKTPNGVEIRVRDTGSGIPGQHLPHVFDRFYRADPARSSSESTGLGLAVVKSIVELHGGEVRVDSVVGQGSSFTLLLP